MAFFFLRCLFLVRMRSWQRGLGSSHLGLGLVHLVHTPFFKSFFGFETPVHWSIIRVERSLELLFNFGPACGREYYVHVLDVFTRRLSRALQPDTPGGNFPGSLQFTSRKHLGKGFTESACEGEANFRRCRDEPSIALDGHCRFTRAGLLRLTN